MKSYFTDRELSCKCGKCVAARGDNHDGSNNMNNDFMNKLNELRARYGKPMYLSSAYRCPEYNDEVSSSGKTGPHTTGKAVDIIVHGENAYTIMKLALEYGFTGIGVKQSSAFGGRFIHLDTLPTGILRPRIWSY